MSETQDETVTRSFANMFIALVLGAVTAFGLFWIMQALVSKTGELKEAGSRLSVDFVRLRRDNAPEVKKREPPKREKPEQAPPPPEMNMAKAMNPSEAVGEIVPMVDSGMELEQATDLGTGGGSSDRAPVPLVRVDPEYPPRAKQQGLRGWVIVEFTISEAGTVRDERVLQAEPTYVFDREALRAVKKWRYNPQTQDGQPVSRPGVKVKFTFDPSQSR